MEKVAAPARGYLNACLPNAPSIFLVNDWGEGFPDAVKGSPA
jgi:hypothetical protein